MKILLVSTGSGSRGGGEIFLDYLGQGLADRGHQVVMWIPAHPRMNELAEKCSRFSRIIRPDYRNTYDHRARSLSTCFNWGVSRRAAREWNELRPDIIHLNKQNLEDGLDLLRAVKQCSAPSICTIHLTQTAHHLRAQSPALRDWIARNALIRYPGVLVTVQEGRRAALDAFLGGRVRTRTIFNGVPLVDQTHLLPLRQAKRRELGLNDKDFLIIGLGRLVKQKQPFVFLETARKLHQYFPATKFLWVGDGNLSQQWNEWVTREGLGSFISCAGWQTDATPFLLAADLLLHVAEYEGLPLAIIEAMAAGLPCAVTRNLTEEIPLFNEGNVFFTDDPVILAKRLQSASELDAIASNARQLVENQLSLRGMVEAYEKLYGSVSRE